MPLAVGARGLLARLGAALLVTAAVGCSTATRPAADSCPGFVAARPNFPRIPEYPPPARKMQMSGESTHEVVVDASGKVGDVRLVGTTFMIFAQSADSALRRTTYFPATLEGRPVASRFWVRVPFGNPQGIESTAARNRVTVYVPGSESPRARWQLADGVRRVTVVADVATAPAAEVSAVAIDPAGAEWVLVKAGKASSRRLAMTVRTGDFFAKAGDYRVQLRHGERPIAEGGFRVAESEKAAVVNACGAP